MLSENLLLTLKPSCIRIYTKLVKLALKLHFSWKPRKLINKKLGYYKLALSWFKSNSISAEDHQCVT